MVMVAAELGRRAHGVFHNFLYGAEPKRVDPTRQAQPLTERLSYILKYVKEVSIQDMYHIIGTPGYDIMTPYFSLKLLDTQPDMQIQMLDRLVNTFGNGGNYAEAARGTRETFTPNGVPTPNTLKSVSAVELSRVATWGPDQIERRAHEVLETTRQNGEVPVIVAYGGLVSLRAAVDTTPPGGEFFLVMPKKLSTEEAGYKINRDGEGFSVDRLNQEDLLTSETVALIDDATHTGSTFDLVGGAFPNAQVKTSPLFITS